ncbi:MAG: DUF3021 domain-containing protein [Lachnospiraceae bacterium]|nr:DUF3021 domain-containing protein [Lachnospiraceae bacterium]
MNKMKLVFSQTLMISTAILFGIGIQAALAALFNKNDYIVWEWYIPFSIILTGFLCALPSVLITGYENLKKTMIRFRILLHIVSIWGMVSLSGYIFKWYTDLFGWIGVSIMYFFIYFFVWFGSWWLDKEDDKKINNALDDIRDDE